MPNLDAFLIRKNVIKNSLGDDYENLPWKTTVCFLDTMIMQEKGLIFKNHTLRSIQCQGEMSRCPQLANGSENTHTDKANQYSKMLASDESHTVSIWSSCD